MYKQFTDEQINKYEFSSNKTFTLNQTQVTRRQFLSESLDETADRFYKFARINLYLSGSDLANENAKFNTIPTVGDPKNNDKMFFRKFYNSGSLLFISQSQFGDGIKKGSFSLTDNSTSATIKIIDDSNGNLFSTNATFSQSVSALSSSDNYVGNIFYDKGLAVITENSAWSGSVKYSNLADNFTLKFDSQHTITTHEYNVTLLPQDYNLTTNYSIRNVLSTDTEPLKLSTQFIASPFTGSDFQPYITTINLYQDGDYDTPVIQATLPRPIKKSDKINTRFKIKLDI